MNLIHEDLARAHIRQQVEYAQHRRRATQLRRVRRLNRLADIAAQAARLAESRLL